jgi:NTF2 fold immunity protein
MRLHHSNFERVLPTAQALCAAIFLIALTPCKDQNTGPLPAQSLAQPSESPSASIATPTSQTTPPAAPTPYPPNKFKSRDEGYVPDATTAIKIAEAVWIPIFGKRRLSDEKPFTARLVNGVWYVAGTLPKGTRGGTAFAEISKETGCIIKVGHGK